MPCADGGEEFRRAAANCPPDEVIAPAERLCSAIPDGQACSAGIAYWDGEESPEALVGRADTALYEGKRAGRDRIITAHETPGWCIKEIRHEKPARTSPRSSLNTNVEQAIARATGATVGHARWADTLGLPKSCVPR